MMKGALGNYYFYLLICIWLISWKVNSYSREEMIHDRTSLNLNDLVPFRGPILTDLWTTDHDILTEREKRVCNSLFQKALATVNGTSSPPREIPVQDREAYLLGGKTILQSWFIDSDVYNGVKVLNWTKSLIDQYRTYPSSCGDYDRPWCDEITRKYIQSIQQNNVAVIGSEFPWAEAAILNLHPHKLITIEYSKIYTDYPNYSTFHPSEVARDYLQGEWELLDAAFSYSSLEHDGLGRYGDPLSPFADLESIARIRCLLKPGGVLFLGIPVGADTLAWNAHRIYGKYRLALVSLGWEILDFYPESVPITGIPGEFDQPIIVLQKPSLVTAREGL